jgi:hypothetical protein
LCTIAPALPKNNPQARIHPEKSMIVVLVSE